LKNFSGAAFFEQGEYFRVSQDHVTFPLFFGEGLSADPFQFLPIRQAVSRSLLQ
jgi:hypothetical protein